MKKSIVSFQTFKEIITQSLALYPKVWWRTFCLNLLSLLLILLTGAILGGIGYGISESMGIPFLEIFDNKVPIEKESIFTILFFIFIGLFFLGTIIFSILGKIATVLMIKRIESKKKQKKTTLWNIYFKEAPKFFGRSVMNILRILWYVLWPLLVIAAISAILFFGVMFIPNDLPLFEGMNFIHMAVGAIGTILGIYFLIKRSVAVSFTQNTLLIKDTSSKKSFEKSISMAKGKIWKLILFYAAIGGIGVIITGLFDVIPNEYGIEFGDILTQIVLPPFAITVYYLLTNTLLKSK